VWYPFVPTLRLDPAHFALQPPETRGLLHFRTFAGQQLHAQTDAQERYGTSANFFAQHPIEPAFAQVSHGIRESAYTREDDVRGTAELPRVASYNGRSAAFFDRSRDRIEIAHSVIYDRHPVHTPTQAGCRLSASTLS
jgi:hypothetical protein